MTGAGIGAGFLAGAAFGWAPPSAVGVLLLAWLFAVRRSVSPVPLVLIAGAVVLGDWRGTGLPDPPMPQSLLGATAITGTIREFPRIGGSDQVFFLDIDQRSPERSTECEGRLRLFVRAPLLPESRFGDRVWVVGELEPAGGLEAGFARYLRSECAVGTYSAFSIRIEERDDGPGQRLFAATSWLDSMLTRIVPGDRGALLSGLVTGRDDSLSEERREAFRNTGTSHITAISGSNLALLVTIATLSGRFMGLRRRRSWQVGLIAALWAYALLTGLNLPVGRAALVATGAVVAAMVGRRADMLTLLLVAGAAMVAVEPIVLWSLSFQLSMAASAALAVVLDEDVLATPHGWVTALLTTNIAAQIATLPFAVGAFGQIPLLAIPANLLVAPLAQLAFVLAATAGLVGGAGEVVPLLSPVGELLAACAALPAGIILFVVDTLAGFKGATVSVHARPFEIGGLAALCAAIICLLSPDGQRWLARTAADVPRHRTRVATLIGVGMAAGFVAIAIARTTS